MARRSTWVAAGIYQPIHQRKAYGRRSYSRMLLEELPISVSVRHASDAPAPHAPIITGGARRLAQPMPNGGVRWVLECPGCRRHVRMLYYRADLWEDGFFARQGMHSGMCRQCWGFAYRSQYQGRRPEAHPERLQRLDAAAHNAKSERAHKQRHARYMAASATVCRRADRYIARRELALSLAMTILLAREVNRENRRWARRILPAVLRSTPAQRRQIAAMRDTPAWARDAILASLVSQEAVSSPAQNASSAPVEAQNTPQNSVKKGVSAHLGVLISEEQIAELRAAYAALGQARRHAKAA